MEGDEFMALEGGVTGFVSHWKQSSQRAGKLKHADYEEIGEDAPWVALRSRGLEPGFRRWLYGRNKPAASHCEDPARDRWPFSHLLPFSLLFVLPLVVKVLQDLLRRDAGLHAVPGDFSPGSSGICSNTMKPMTKK